MIWNDHKNLEGKHAFLGASQWRWLTWDDETLANRYYSQFAQEIGTVAHEIASDCIRSGTKLNRSDRHLIELYMYKNFIPKIAYDYDGLLSNLVPFVNDAIGFHMTSEVVLFYSANAFGTTDAIVYDEKYKTLRIHDLKTGSSPAHIEQLMIYAALFCLEYKIQPETLKGGIILRIYQNSEVIEVVSDPMEIENIMKLIKDTDNKILEIRGVKKYER